MSPTFTPESPPAAHNGTAPVAPPPPLTDQEQFDAAVSRDMKIVLQALAGVAIFAALLMSSIALVRSGGHSTAAAATAPVAAVAAAPVAAVPSGPAINVSITGSSKRGPGGKMHDAFSTTDFAVKVGKPTRLRITNNDNVPHSITSPATGVSIIAMPGVHTYTLLATKAGHFLWNCVIPCDTDSAGWAMNQPGYMAGYITAT